MCPTCMACAGCRTAARRAGRPCAQPHCVSRAGAVAGPDWTPGSPAPSAATTVTAPPVTVDIMDGVDYQEQQGLKVCLIFSVYGRFQEQAGDLSLRTVVHRADTISAKVRTNDVGVEMAVLSKMASDTLLKKVGNIRTAGQTSVRFDLPCTHPVGCCTSIPSPADVVQAIRRHYSGIPLTSAVFGVGPLQSCTPDV
eukprot:gene6172-1103_t